MVLSPTEQVQISTVFDETYDVAGNLADFLLPARDLLARSILDHAGEPCLEGLVATENETVRALAALDRAIMVAGVDAEHQRTRIAVREIDAAHPGRLDAVTALSVINRESGLRDRWTLRDLTTEIASYWDVREDATHTWQTWTCVIFPDGSCLIYARDDRASDGREGWMVAVGPDGRRMGDWGTVPV